MDILSELFGSVMRVKMMRIFLFNQGNSFDIEYIEGKTDAKPSNIKKEIIFFKKLGLIKPKKLSEKRRETLLLRSRIQVLLWKRRPKKVVLGKEIGVIIGSTGLPLTILFRMSHGEKSASVIAIQTTPTLSHERSRSALITIKRMIGAANQGRKKYLIPAAMPDIKPHAIRVARSRL